MTGNEALLTFALIAGGFLLGGVMFSRAPAATSLSLPWNLSLPRTSTPLAST